MTRPDPILERYTALVITSDEGYSIVIYNQSDEAVALTVCAEGMRKVEILLKRQVTDVSNTGGGQPPLRALAMHDVGCHSNPQDLFRAR